MNIPNLHSLLSAITVEQLKFYLGKTGWSEHFADGRLNFAKEDAHNELQRIFVPTDRAHPRFRSLLQNLMFSLSVIESREPADIAHEIASCQVLDRCNTLPLTQHVHEIASLVRGLVQECHPTESAKGKILELARFLLKTHSMTLSLTPHLANELWETALSDQSYLPSATSAWLEANATNLLAKINA